MIFPATFDSQKVICNALSDPNGHSPETQLEKWIIYRRFGELKANDFQ